MGTLVIFSVSAIMIIAGFWAYLYNYCNSLERAVKDLEQDFLELRDIVERLQGQGQG